MSEDFLFEMPPPPMGELSTSERALMIAHGCDESMMRATAYIEGKGRAAVMLFFFDFARRGPRVLAEFKTAAAAFSRVKRKGSFGSEWLRGIAKLNLLVRSVESGEPEESLANTITPRFYVSLAMRYLPEKIACRIRCSFPLAEMLWTLWQPKQGVPRR